jgi:hypothetical protein
VLGGMSAFNASLIRPITSPGDSKDFSSAIQVGLLAALVDIYRHPREEIRGSKPWWTAASFVNFVGPVSYFLFGRKR